MHQATDHRRCLKRCWNELPGAQTPWKLIWQWGICNQFQSDSFHRALMFWVALLSPSLLFPYGPNSDISSAPFYFYCTAPVQLPQSSFSHWEGCMSFLFFLVSYCKAFPLQSTLCFVGFTKQMYLFFAYVSVFFFFHLDCEHLEIRDFHMSYISASRPVLWKGTKTTAQRMI